MTCLIFYCQLVQYLFINDRFPPLERIIPQYENNILFKINVFFYDLWNLDFLHYVAPPFCISRSFKLIHTILPGYVSVLYPLCLIVLTWVCIKLHDENFQPIVWLWRPFHRCLVKLRRGYGSSNSIIDVFSAFFLLSYSKLMFQIAFVFSCTQVINISDDSRYHENSVGLSSTTNPNPKGQPSISLPAQANLTQQKAEPLRCLALRTRGVRLRC